MTELVERVAPILIEVFAWVAVTMCPVLLLGEILRWRSTERALRSRVRLAVLPTETFDPTDEEVLRYAHQLTRVHRTVLGVLDRPGSAVRIRLESLPDGRVAYLLEGPARAASILRAGGFEDVELRPVDDEIPAPAGVALPVVAASSGPEPERGGEVWPPPDRGDD